MSRQPISVVRDGIRYLELREMPKPEPKVDWAAFEMRIAVAVQDGTIFIDTETTGPDFYSEYGSKRFGVPPENITPAMRRMVKNDVFCRLYGGSGVFTP